MPYNMYQYIDEVKARMSRYDVQAELDTGKLEMIINRVRRDVQLATLPIYRERYGRIAIISTVPTVVSNYSFGNVDFYSAVLPTDFIEEDVALVTHESYQWEARKLIKQELYGVARNSWVNPTTNSPVYIVERDPSSATSTIYVSKGSAVVGASEIELWYVAALPYLQAHPVSGTPDVERKMSYQWEELVVLCSMARAYEMQQFLQLRDLIVADIQTVISLMEESYKTNVDRSKLLLPTRESIVPNVPISDVPMGGGNGN